MTGIGFEANPGLLNGIRGKMPPKIHVDLQSIRDKFNHHSRDSVWWKASSESYIQLFSETIGSEVFSVDLGGVQVEIPMVSFGAVSSVDLFGLDELIIFSFYQANSGRYSRVADLGANIGIHSLVLAKMGMSVEAYEPDPEHTNIAKRVLSLPEISGLVSWVEKAVVPNAKSTPEIEFVRVLGNTTSSHVAGAKPDPYGELKTFTVKTESLQNIAERAQLIKMDVEGLEADLLESLTSSTFESTDFMLEVGTPENAKRIFDLGKRFGLNLFSQKANWSLVKSLSEVPSGYREGSLFVTNETGMNWG